MGKWLAHHSGEVQEALPSDVVELVDQLERHCLAPDGSLTAKSAYNDLQLAREEMSRERQRYLEAMAIYSELISMVDEYNQAVSIPNLGGGRDFQGLQLQSTVKNSSQIYELLEHRLVVAEASQKLRLPLISKDVEINEEEIERLNTSNTGGDGEPGIGGARNCFLGITPSYLEEANLKEMTASSEITNYQMPVSCEIEARLKAKYDKIASAFEMDCLDASSTINSSSAQLPERVKSMIDEIEKEEAALQDDLFSANRKFAEYYNVIEHIPGVLIKLVKDLKLQHQHTYDEMQKTWLCKRCETMSAKLRVLEHVLLLETYTKDSVPALHKIRKYLIEATEEASIAYNKAVTRLREYQGVDPHFDSIARQYHDIVQKLENMRWTIHQVEMDLTRLPNNSGA